MSNKRIKCKGYRGVYYRFVARRNGKGREKVFYIVFKKDGKVYEEKVGYQFRDDMTPARASRIRAMRIEGKIQSRKEKREEEQREKERIRWTIDRIWREYLSLKPIKGKVQDMNRFENYLRGPFGEKLPSQIAPLDIDRLRKSMEKAGKSPATIRNVLELLRRIINFGVNARLCEPLGFRIKMPRVNNEKTEDLSPEQLRSLLKAIEEDLHPVAGKIMFLALYTGMRRSEIFRLRWEDIDFEKGFIKIRNPKGGKDQVIPLNDGAREVLESIYPGENEYVFPGRGGKGHIKDIHRAVNRIRDRAGLPKEFRPLHGLRHVYASMLASSGKVDLYTLQKLLTHKSPRMVMRYAHLRDEALKKASDLATEIVQDAVEQPSNVISLKR